MGTLWLFGDPFKKCDRKYQERKVLRKPKNMKDNWTGHILCRNCLLTHVVEGTSERKIEKKRRRRRRRKQLLDDFKETILEI
jgi:hypothetical protein